jgi:hypothetical protein
MKVSELLRDPSRWIKHAMARDALGELVPTCDTKACQWCLIGAVSRCDVKSKPIRDAIEKLFPDRFRDSILFFNDHPDTTFADVQAVLKEANA